MKPKILILDENPRVHALISQSLNKQQLDLHHEFSAPRFLEQARRVNPQLILLSAQRHFDHRHWCTRWQAQQKTEATPILLLAHAELATEGLTDARLGIVGVLRKPFEASEIQTQIGMQIAQNVGLTDPFYQESAGEIEPSAWEERDLVGAELHEMLHESSADLSIPLSSQPPPSRQYPAAQTEAEPVTERIAEPAIDPVTAPIAAGVLEMDPHTLQAEVTPTYNAFQPSHFDPESDATTPLSDPAFSDPALSDPALSDPAFSEAAAETEIHLDPLDPEDALPDAAAETEIHLDPLDPADALPAETLPTETLSAGAPLADRSQTVFLEHNPDLDPPPHDIELHDVDLRDPDFHAADLHAPNPQHAEAQDLELHDVDLHDPDPGVPDPQEAAAPLPTSAVAGMEASIPHGERMIDLELLDPPTEEPTAHSEEATFAGGTFEEEFEPAFPRTTEGEIVAEGIAAEDIVAGGIAAGDIAAGGIAAGDVTSAIAAEGPTNASWERLEEEVDTLLMGGGDELIGQESIGEEPIAGELIGEEVPASIDLPTWEDLPTAKPPEAANSDSAPAEMLSGLAGNEDTQLDASLDAASLDAAPPDSVSLETVPSDAGIADVGLSDTAPLDTESYAAPGFEEDTDLSVRDGAATTHFDDALADLQRELHGSEGENLYELLAAEGHNMQEIAAETASFTDDLGFAEPLAQTTTARITPPLVAEEKAPEDLTVDLSGDRSTDLAADPAADWTLKNAEGEAQRFMDEVMENAETAHLSAAPADDLHETPQNDAPSNDAQGRDPRLASPIALSLPQDRTPQDGASQARTPQAETLPDESLHAETLPDETLHAGAPAVIEGLEDEIGQRLHQVLDAWLQRSVRRVIQEELKTWRPQPPDSP